MAAKDIGGSQSIAGVVMSLREGTTKNVEEGGVAGSGFVCVVGQGEGLVDVRLVGGRDECGRDVNRLREKNRENVARTYCSHSSHRSTQSTLCFPSYLRPHSLALYGSIAAGCLKPITPSLSSPQRVSSMDQAQRVRTTLTRRIVWLAIRESMPVRLRWVGSGDRTIAVDVLSFVLSIIGGLDALVDRHLLRYGLVLGGLGDDSTSTLAATTMAPHSSWP